MAPAQERCGARLRPSALQLHRRREPLAPPTPWPGGPSAPSPGRAPSRPPGPRPPRAPHTPALWASSSQPHTRGRCLFQTQTQKPGRGARSAAFFLVRQDAATVFSFCPLRSISLATLRLLRQHRPTPSGPFIKTLFRANNSLAGPAAREAFQGGSREAFPLRTGHAAGRRKSGARGPGRLRQQMGSCPLTSYAPCPPGGPAN